MHGRVLIEQGQEHHDAFDNGRLDLAIQVRPRVVEPAMDCVEAMTAVRADGGAAGPDLEGHTVFRQVGLEQGVVRVRHVALAERHPQRERRLSHLTLVVFATNRHHVRRVLKLCRERANVLLDLSIFDNEPVHFRQRGVPLGNPA